MQRIGESMRASIRRRRSLDRFEGPYKYALTLDDVSADELARIRKALAVEFAEDPGGSIFSPHWKLDGMRV